MAGLVPPPLADRLPVVLNARGPSRWQNHQGLPARTERAPGAGRARRVVPSCPISPSETRPPKRRRPSLRGGFDGEPEREYRMARISMSGVCLAAALLTTISAGKARGDAEARCCQINRMGGESSCHTEIFNGGLCSSLCDTLCANAGGCASRQQKPEPPGSA
jgi:hypothetical protein